MTEQDNNLAPGEVETDYWRKGKRLLIEIEFTKDVHRHDNAIARSLYDTATRAGGGIEGEFNVQVMYMGTFKEHMGFLKGKVNEVLDEIENRA